MPKENIAQSSLYFIALIPPEPIAATVTAVKEHMAETYQSKGALRSPPHITLHMPFRWPDKKHLKLQKFLEDFVRAHHPFEIKLEGFGTFAPRVIFVNVKANEQLNQLQQDLLKGMRKDLNIFNGDYKQKAFHPHMTVAFRDLKPRHFKSAWEVYQHKTFSFDFVASQIHLLKHNGQNWEVSKGFNLREAFI